ncbi:hypothetical protein [Phenylobacterium sp.]|uniref:hypothetical protein n=1 Tax=Phenylobacterium sp. TaxID=1871053 RepID=UPI003BADA5F6
MKIHITATTCANPALFAHIIRSEILAALPGADVSVRPIFAPAARRVQMIDVGPEGAFLVELLPAVLDLVRSDLADEVSIFAEQYG